MTHTDLRRGRAPGLIGLAAVAVAALGLAGPSGALAQSAPPNPPDQVSPEPTTMSLLNQAASWAEAAAASLPAALSGNPDVLVITGDTSAVTPQTVAALHVKPDGARRLLIAAGTEATAAAAIAAMSAGYDGIALPAASDETMQTVIGDLRRRNPAFVIMMDLGSDLPPVADLLPDVDGFLVHDVLTDASGSAYPKDKAAERSLALSALVARGKPVLVSEDGATPAIDKTLKELGAVPAVAD